MDLRAGGIGPTHDDITYEAIASALGMPPEEGTRHICLQVPGGVAWLGTLAPFPT